MTTHLLTVKPDDTLSHAAQLFRQYQFHHLPVVKSLYPPQAKPGSFQRPAPKLILQGILMVQDIDLAIAQQQGGSDPGAHLWQERLVAEMMHQAEIWVTPTTAVDVAARLLLERGINGVPVLEMEQQEQEPLAVLVGMLTRSDLLLALTQVFGCEEPGTLISVDLPAGEMTPLTRVLLAASELHVGIGSLIATPRAPSLPRRAYLRLCTINPGPLLTELSRKGITYSFGDTVGEGENHE
jgi:acetoin utilization protein AcuB